MPAPEDQPEENAAEFQVEAMQILNQILIVHGYPGVSGEGDPTATMFLIVGDHLG